MTAPRLDGIHHVKLPVRNLARSRAWYESQLGYRAAIEFTEQGSLMGISMRHPNGGPEFALRLDPARAEAAAGFDYFAIGVPSKEAIDYLAARLTALGEQHAGVHYATIGWILPQLHDPNGHKVRFYTTAHHSEPPGDGILRIDNPRETAEAAMPAEGEPERSFTRSPHPSHPRCTPSSSNQSTATLISGRDRG